MSATICENATEDALPPLRHRNARGGFCLNRRGSDARNSMKLSGLE